MLLINYERRWRNLLLHPTKSRRDLNNKEEYKTKYTSSTKGYSKLSWGQDGVAEFNKWIDEVVMLRGATRTGKLLEARVEKTMSWKRNKNKRKRDQEVIHILPRMGSGLMAKLASVAKKTASV